MIDAITNARLVGLRREQIAGLVARAQLDEKFQSAVTEFKAAIAGLNVTVAAMDKEYERRILGAK